LRKKSLLLTKKVVGDRRKVVLFVEFCSDFIFKNKKEQQPKYQIDYMRRKS